MYACLLCTHSKKREHFLRLTLAFSLQCGSELISGNVILGGLEGWDSAHILLSISRSWSGYIISLLWWWHRYKSETWEDRMQLQHLLQDIHTSEMKLQFNSVQFNSIWFDSVHFSSVNSVRFNSIQINLIQCTSFWFDSIQLSSIEFSTFYCVPIGQLLVQQVEKYIHHNLSLKVAFWSRVGPRVSKPYNMDLPGILDQYLSFQTTDFCMFTNISCGATSSLIFVVLSEMSQKFSDEFLFKFGTDIQLLKQPVSSTSLSTLAALLGSYLQETNKTIYAFYGPCQMVLVGEFTVRRWEV